MKKYNVINRTLGWLMFVIATVTYMLTLEPTASFWDCPEFIAQGFKLEVGHPPGNPIFMLAARFVINFVGNDISKVALAVNAMSALLSAGTILLLFWTITHLVKRIIVKDDAEEVSLIQMLVIFGSGICGSLVYAWSDTFWFSAVEAEVYAFSSFCTALVFWLILKWENHANEEHSDRYLILIAYVIGVSVAVHLLNLLCIPAIVLVFYYKKYKDITVKGSLIALLISFAIIALILYGLVPGFVEMGQWFELMLVNGFGASYNTGVLVYAILDVAIFAWCIYELYKQRSATLIKLSFFLSVFFSGMLFIGDGFLLPFVLIAALAVYLWKFCKKIPVRIFSIVAMSIFVIFVGYSSYAVILIRSNAQTPMDQNSPDNVFALSSYLNREQYGDRPLLYGQTFNSGVVYQESTTGSLKPVVSEGKTLYAKKVKKDASEPDEYIAIGKSKDYKMNPELDMVFPRMYSGAHAKEYKEWVGMKGNQVNVTSQLDRNGNPVGMETKLKPTFLENLKFFLDYQLSYMYWRYFMWNFAGRQNDIQGSGEITQGNWISGIPFIDNLRLGDQSLMPTELTTGNKGHNVFFMLPLIFGIIGLLWQAYANKRGIEQFWVIFFLFFMTGIAIVIYLNQTPSQPRERDYAYAGSFYAFAIWVGMGVAGLWKLIIYMMQKLNKKAVIELEGKKSLAAACIAAVVGLIIPLQVVSQTWDDHDRSGRYCARDFGKNYLASVDENGIIFTNGDNDTFPLWYAQEVEGYRTDVRVVNLSYLSTDWYINQMRRPAYDSKPLPMLADGSTFAYDQRQYGYFIEPDTLPVPALKSLEHFYGNNSKNTLYNLHEMKYPVMYIPVDADAVVKQKVVPERYKDFINNNIVMDMTAEKHTASEGAMNTSKVMSLDIIASSIADGWKRPVYFAMTVPEKYYLGLSPYMLNTGMAYQVTPVLYNASGSAGVNTDKMYDNVTTKFLWGGLDTAEPGSIYLDETTRRMVSTTRSSMLDLASTLIQEGYTEEMSIEDDKTLDEAARKAKKDHAADRYNKAREILDLMVTKLPEKACPYSIGIGEDVANKYYLLSDLTGNKEDLKKAEEIITHEVMKYAEFLRFYHSLDPSMYYRLNNYDMYIDQNLFVTYLQTLNDIAGEEKLNDVLAKVEEMGVNMSRIANSLEKQSEK